MKFPNPEQIEKAVTSYVKDPAPFVDGASVAQQSQAPIARFLSAGWRFSEADIDPGIPNEQLDQYRFLFLPCFEEKILEEDAMIIDSFIKEIRQAAKILRSETIMKVASIINIKNEFTGQRIQCVDPSLWYKEDFDRSFKYPERFYPPNYLMIEKH